MPAAVIDDTILSLMDELTPYYRRKMSAVSAQQRRVICVLARNGVPMNSTRIAKDSRLDPRVSSMALTRLKKKGYVKHQNRQWELSDPWFGVWYRLRRGSADPMVPTDTDPPVKPSLWDSILLASGENIGQKLPPKSKWESDMRRIYRERFRNPN